MSKVQATGKITKSGAPMSRGALFNAVRAAAGPEFNTTIPMIDATNVNHYSRVIAADASLLDEFTKVLLTKVVALYVHSQDAWDNPMNIFYAGNMPKGIGIETLARSLFPAKNWEEAIDNNNGVDELFKEHKDDVVALIHTIDEMLYFPITVWNDERLFNSLVTDEGLNAFIEDIFTQLRNSKEVYLYDRIMKTINDFLANPEVAKLEVKVDAVTDEASAKKLLVEAQAALGEFKFVTKDNNLQGVDMHSRGKTPVLITTPRIKAHIDINALAAMFNLNKEVVTQYILEVDSLPVGTQAILTTDKFIQMYTRTDKITNMLNPIADRTNYFNLLQVLVANNQFENVRIFKDVLTVEE